MLLPFREHLDFGPTPYDQLQAREGIPIIRGYVVSDVMKLELGRWREWEPRVVISILRTNSKRTPMFVKFRPAAKPCRSAIFSKRLFTLSKDAALLRYGKKEPAKLRSNGPRARSSRFP